MEMTESRWVGVQVDQARAVCRVTNGKAGLLFGLAERGVPGQLTPLDVAAWLDPQPETLVEMEYRSPTPVHEARGRYVDWARVPVEGVVEPAKLLEEALLGASFSLRALREGDHCGTYGARKLRDPIMATLAGLRRRRLAIKSEHGQQANRARWEIG